ncbi:MAG TPA: FAD-binding oxidoreductase [Candidatus Paceibacterota bacterium]|nr:FAD-binding oxidoreductase [Candidatus Paceibacterota bacterium]
MAIIDDLKSIVKGDIAADGATLKKYSRDASLLEVEPRVVVFPTDAVDIARIVHYVAGKKPSDPTLSITLRGAGTDMGGGAINESIIVDTTRHMHAIISVDEKKGIVEPGCFYRDFEKETLRHGSIMPAYPASKDLCTVGGMTANNSGGEKSIKYGKVERYVKRQRVIFTDAKEYEVVPLSKAALDEKMAQGDFEGMLYKKLFDLIEANYDIIQNAKPTVSKNSAGYYLWNVWDRTTQIFDLNKLIVGSQGTLAITTLVEFALVPVPKYSRMVIMYLKSLDRLGEIVDTVMRYQPESFESYDDYSMRLAISFMGGFFKQLGFFGAIQLGIQFIPDIFRLLTGGIPKLVLLAEVAGENEQEVMRRAIEIRRAVKPFGFKTHVARSAAEAQKYWKVRRESFNLLRKHSKGKQTAPFIDDIIVNPHDLPKFLPQLQAIVDEHKLVYTIAGHAGNGNFHVIPLMDLNNPLSPDVILEVSKKVYALVAKYKGSITAEHNDGIIRTPFLPYMYPPEIIALFAKVKEIFDPQDMFNPGKKVGGSFDYITSHLVKRHDSSHAV